MSFKAVAKRIAGNKGVSIERASAMLAAGTRRTMAKHGMSTKHGIPKNVFSKKAFKGQHHQVMKKYGAMS